MSSPFPTSLEGFGYEFNDAGRLCQLSGNAMIEHFKFEGKEHYDAIGEVITDYVHKLLLELGLHKIYISNPEISNSSFVFGTKTDFTNTKKLLILIHGSENAGAGQWSRYQTINGSLERGTQIPYIKQAMKEGYDLLITDYNCERVNKHLFFASRIEEHIATVVNPIIEPAFKTIGCFAIVAHSYDCIGALQLAAMFPKELMDKCFAIAFMTHPYVPNLLSDGMQTTCIDMLPWFKLHSRNYVKSDQPLGTQLNESLGNGIPRFSAGSGSYKLAPWACIEAIFPYLKSQYFSFAKEKNSNRNTMSSTSIIHFEGYRSPLSMKNTTTEMRFLFSDQFKYSTWRKLWIFLAKAEKELGLEITEEQIEQMEAHRDQIDFIAAADRERKTHHDVMAHIQVFAQQCPLAARIIHLGATSNYVNDNTDSIILRDALDLLLAQLARVIYCLTKFAEKFKSLPSLCFPHLEPTELITVGERATLRLSYLLDDTRALRRCRDDLRFHGIKETAGTQASLLQLFNGDTKKVKELDQRVSNLAGFANCYAATEQTYLRKVDFEVISALTSLGTTAQKLCSDLRVPAVREEIQEPFQQIEFGVRRERCYAIIHHLIKLHSYAANAYTTQWLERTLIHESANRRLTLSEAFLSADAILLILLDISQSLRDYPEVIVQYPVNEFIEEEVQPFLQNYKDALKDV